MSPHIDEVTEVPCAACGQPLDLTWTKSADGWRIYHGACFEQKEAQK